MDADGPYTEPPTGSLMSNINCTSTLPLMRARWTSLPKGRGPKGRQFVAIAMDSQGGGSSRPHWGWETLEDDPLGEIISRSDFLTSAKLSGTCTKYFKMVRKYAWEKAMLVGLPCVLENEDVSWGSLQRGVAVVASWCPLRCWHWGALGFCPMSRSVMEFHHVTVF